jgi:signal transduction histidine kinase
MKHPSLARRIIGWQIFMMGISWLVLVAWLLHMMTAFENGDLDRRMKYFAEILAETASGSINSPDLLAQRLRATEKTFVEGVIETLENASGYKASYQVFDARGTLLYRTGLAPAAPLTASAGLSVATRDGGERWRLARVRSSDQSVTVIVGEREADRWSSVLPMLQIIGAAQVLILASSLLITWWATRRGVRPLRTLAETISRRRAGDPTPISAPLVYAETVPIVRELNALLHRESLRLESERGFLADAAHELRTPLAAIGTQAHLVLGAADESERHRFARALESGLERVSHLLAQLLTIARVDAPGAQFDLERTDVATLVRERLAGLSIAARARSISLTLDCPDVLVANVNPAGFISIVDNLVDNAIRYTPSGGHVAVRLEMTAAELEFAVRDDGPGIAAEERDRVFERFYRIPGSTAQGSGLGLAIVQRIARAHDASVRFVDGLKGAGIGVVVRLRSSPATKA